MSGREKNINGLRSLDVRTIGDACTLALTSSSTLPSSIPRNAATPALVRRRTYVERIFPNSKIRLRLVRALAVETDEDWMEANRHLNMDDPKEHKKLELRKAA